MRHTVLVLSAAAVALASAAAAQGRAARGARDQAPPAPRIVRPLAARATADGDPLASLGIAAATSGGARDTLGLLISTVAPGGPADRAGVDAGSRLAEINGVSLRSTGDDGSTDTMLRRVERALGASKQGAVSLRLYRGGRYRVVTITPEGGAKAEVAATTEPAPAVAAVAAVAPSVAAVTAPSTPRAAAVAAVAPAGTTTLASVIDATVQTQAQLGRLVSQEEATDGPMLDSLAVIQQELRALQRRLRAMQARGAPKPATVAGAAAAPDADVPLDGLKLGPVTDELVAYYGEGSDAGLLVLQSDAAWAPLRAGDVILRVDGAAVTTSALRAASVAGAKIDVLRRRRTVTVVLPARE